MELIAAGKSGKNENQSSKIPLLITTNAIVPPAESSKSNPAQFLARRKPKTNCIVFAPNFLSPAVSSISLTISLAQFNRKANPPNTKPIISANLSGCKVSKGKMDDLSPSRSVEVINSKPNC